MPAKTDRKIHGKLRNLPKEPGVYIMEGRGGEVLYVGKGRDLRTRVRSYFHASRPLHPRIDAMVSRIEDIRWIVTDSEVEALILESNLIKEYKPRYNVNLKDDKRYPYLKVTVHEDYPRILVTRRLRDDGARYFGPYTAVGKMRTSLALIKKIFPVRSCHYDLPDEIPARVCLDYHIGQCLGPCHGHQSREEYRRVIDEVILFLSGRNRRVTRLLRAEMRRAVEAMNYEKAARLRDQIDCLKTIQERQKVRSVRARDLDLVALCREGEDACGLVMKIREGIMLGSRHLYLENAGWQSDSTILEVFLTQFYGMEMDPAPEIVLPFECEDLSLLSEWFARRQGRPPRFHVPRRGEKKKLIDLAMKNSRLLMAELKARAGKGADGSSPGLLDLQRRLGLENPPEKIVCLDISNLQASDAVGSLVRFDRGRPRKSEYRHFRIRSVEGQNDVGMLTEVLERYLLRKAGEDDLPDLIVLDGGKGQLSAGVRVLERFSLADIPICALAKRNEDLYRPGHPLPVRVPQGSPAFRLLCRIRDEAHRFAVTYHRKVRSRRYRESALDGIPGIGEVRKRNLLRVFGSVEKIRSATVDEIARVEGFSDHLSRLVKAHLGR